MREKGIWRQKDRKNNVWKRGEKVKKEIEATRKREKVKRESKQKEKRTE